MSVSLSARTRKGLEGVDRRLVSVFRRAVQLQAEAGKPLPTVTEGLRTMARQRLLVRQGASRTLNSRHLSGRAIDIAFIVGSQVRWDWPLYKGFADRMKRAAKEQNVTIIWGGDWRSFKDGPHFELGA